MHKKEKNYGYYYSTAFYFGDFTPHIPLAFGIALDAAGGAALHAAWGIALCVMAVGPTLSLMALLLAPTARKS